MPSAAAPPPMFIDPSKLRGDHGAADQDVAGAGFEPALAEGALPTPVPMSEDRRGPDRRLEETPRFSPWSWWGGRRRDVRREEEREGSFVDVHGIRLWMVVLWVALMNVGDSYFTLVHLQAGGVEMNPVAQGLLGMGRFAFVFLKSVLIGVALVVLAVHKNFYLARVGVYVSAGTYTLLVIYHLLLFRLN